MNPKSAIAVLGGGCFWCLEAVLQRIKGVDKVVSGYTGNICVTQVVKNQIQHINKSVRERPIMSRCAR
jgi:peptide methionine sulfoxide reductase MsrA